MLEDIVTFMLEISGNKTTWSVYGFICLLHIFLNNYFRKFRRQEHTCM